MSSRGEGVARARGPEGLPLVPPGLPGRARHALNDQALHVDGLPEDPPFKVHVGAIATGAAVQEDPELYWPVAQPR